MKYNEDRRPTVASNEVLVGSGDNALAEALWNALQINAASGATRVIDPDEATHLICGQFARPEGYDQRTALQVELRPMGPIARNAANRMRLIRVSGGEHPMRRTSGFILTGLPGGRKPEQSKQEEDQLLSGMFESGRSPQQEDSSHTHADAKPAVQRGELRLHSTQESAEEATRPRRTAKDFKVLPGKLMPPIVPWNAHLDKDGNLPSLSPSVKNNGSTTEKPCRPRRLTTEDEQRQNAQVSCKGAPSRFLRAQLKGKRHLGHANECGCVCHKSELEPKLDVSKIRLRVVDGKVVANIDVTKFPWCPECLLPSKFAIKLNAYEVSGWRLVPEGFELVFPERSTKRRTLFTSFLARHRAGEANLRADQSLGVEVVIPSWPCRATATQLIDYREVNLKAVPDAPPADKAATP
jgi:hypothetical protein